MSHLPVFPAPSSCIGGNQPCLWGRDQFETGECSMLSTCLNRLRHSCHAAAPFHANDWVDLKLVLRIRRRINSGMKDNVQLSDTYSKIMA